MSNMTTSKEGKAELVGHEGICLQPYYDSVGVKTIGIGATVTEIPDIAKWAWDRKITLEEAFVLFEKSLKRYENALNKHLKQNIPQHMFDALVSWCYNVGTGWVSKATVIRLLNQGVRDNSAYNRKRLYNAIMMYRGSVTRRKKEANLIAYHKYANNGKADLFNVRYETRRVKTRSGEYKNLKGNWPIYGGKTINARDYFTNLNPVPVPSQDIDTEHKIIVEESKLPITENMLHPSIWELLAELFRRFIGK